MDKATEPKSPASGGELRPNGGKTPKLSIHEERIVKVATPAHGSRFKGYTNFVVQDLVIRPHVVNFRRERWQKPDGTTMTAPLPAGVSGHFGPELPRFVLAQYHQGQVTMPRLLALLRAFGILISKRQLERLLIASQNDFLDEARDVLRAGLSSAAWITVDDTGARRKAANGERVLHPDWQRTIRLVWNHAIEEPQQLPRTAARRPWRLCHQCRGFGLYAPSPGR
jgi:hypothetical protein